jgi:hypothetical protein
VIAAIDWTTVASLATAAGTLVLAIATFAAIRSSHESARTAERALLAGLRPVLFPSRAEDPAVNVTWFDRPVHSVPGGQGLVENTGEIIYMAINVRNVGAGIAVLHGWHLRQPDAGDNFAAPGVEQFRMQSRDLYVPPDGTGFWQGALRDADDPDRGWLTDAARAGERIWIDMLYGDLEGGQRTISRFSLRRHNDVWMADVVRHWHIDRPDPR